MLHLTDVTVLWGMSASITEGLYLASQSPRRVALLSQLGLYPSILAAEIEEIWLPNESPQAFVERMARGKANAGMLALGDKRGVVIAADTEVVLDGDVFGKPLDPEHARSMLSRLSGRTHSVISAVCLLDASEESLAISISEVDFATLAPADIDSYIATGEPFGKAGAYAVQGQAASFISAIRGSYSGIMGLPLFETAQLLRARMNRA